MNRLVKDQLAYYRFQSLEGMPLYQAAFTRTGGVSGPPYDSLNIGTSVGDEPGNVRQNLERMYKALAITSHQVVMAQQVHGHRVALVTPDDRGSIVAGVDALITNERGLVLVMRFADCVPILLYDPQHGAIGLVHAGWQGTLQQIARAAVGSMATSFGTQPRSLHAVIGPAIGPCCFQVGPEVVAEVGRTMPLNVSLLSRPTADGRAHLDLWLANRLQLESCGVEQVESANLCTCCHQPEFYSHRGSHGKTGRFGVLIGLV